MTKGMLQVSWKSGHHAHAGNISECLKMCRKPALTLSFLPNNFSQAARRISCHQPNSICADKNTAHHK